MSADGHKISAGCSDGTARVWDSETGRPLVAPFEHGGLVYAVALSPDGRQLATAGGDGTARVWDTETGSPVTRSKT